MDSHDKVTLGTSYHMECITRGLSNHIVGLPEQLIIEPRDDVNKAIGGSWDGGIASHLWHNKLCQWSEAEAVQVDGPRPMKLQISAL